MSDLTRRDFVLATAGVAAACVLCGTVKTACAADEPLQPSIDAGPVDDFKADGAYDKLAKDSKVLIFRQNGKLFATTSQCTHRKVILKVVDGQPRCPAHGSRFGPDGNPTRGPANKPLARYGVKIDDKKHLIVDTTQTFDQPNWNAAGASVGV